MKGKGPGHDRKLKSLTRLIHNYFYKNFIFYLNVFKT